MIDQATARQVALEYLRAYLDRDLNGAIVAFHLLDSVALTGEATDSEAAQISISLAHIAALLTHWVAEAQGLDPHRVLELVAEHTNRP